ncbi:MAG: glycosyltransferase [Lachnospiraceae bacterium]|nr:glycosyltransferase [Lachnospiraceae bacterium]
MPLVSIIMPSLNVAGYIDECLKSATNQTLRDIEIICIDAGSTDGTREIIEKYVTIDSRIKLIDSTVKSYGFQVNLGIQEAKGEYIAILETDDYVDQEMYERLYSCACECNAEYVRADYDEICEVNNYMICNTQHIFNNSLYYDKLFDNRYFKELFSKDQNIWSGIYKKSFLEKYHIRLNETPGAAFQDIGFKLLTLIYAERIMYINYSGYRYRLDRDGCSSCNNNVLKFAWQEFARLLNQMDLSMSDRFKYVILRMIDVFICEHNKLVTKNSAGDQEKFYETYIKPYYFEFKKSINGFLLDGVVSKEDMSELQFMTLMSLLHNEEDYNNTIIQDKEKKENSWNELADKLKDSQIVIVSYGVRGKDALKQLIIRNMNVVAICDNSSEVRAQKIGVPIFSVEVATGLYKNAAYVISNKKYSDELKNQLISYGVSKANIIQMP